MIFYNGFNLLVDMVAVLATMFITYRYAIRKGFMLGMEAEAELSKAISKAMDAIPYGYCKGCKCKHEWPNERCEA